MKKSLKLSALVLSLVLMMTGLAACASSAAPSAAAPADVAAGDAAGLQTLNLKLGHADTEENSIHRAMVRMSEDVKAASGGKITIDVSANAQLGNDRDMMEGMQLGTIDMSCVSTAPMANFVREFSVYDAPFLYTSHQHAYNVADGEVGEILNEKMLAQDIRILGYYAVGFRNIFSNKPIRTMEDLKGLKIRTMENSIQMAAFEELGALPTAMAYSELFTALQQGTLDAAENSTENIVGAKFYEVTKNISLTGHFYCLKPITISELTWQRLSEEARQIIVDAVDASVTSQREEMEQVNIDSEQTLTEFGCTLYSDFDISAMAAAVAPVYDEFPEDLPADLLEKIRATPAQ